MKRPRVVVKVTSVPWWTGLPPLSFTIAVIMTELLPSAGMLASVDSGG